MAHRVGLLIRANTTCDELPDVGIIIRMIIIIIIIIIIMTIMITMMITMIIIIILRLKDLFLKEYAKINSLRFKDYFG